MARQRLLLVGFLLIALLVGCTEMLTTGSGDVVTLEKSFRDFEEVEISSAFTVDIRQGDRYSVIIRVDDNLERYLDVTKIGKTLRIGLKPGAFSFHHVTLEAEITMPVLTGLGLSGASEASISGFESSKAFTADLSGASSLEGELEAGDVDLDVSGASDVTLRGSGSDLTAEASGASSIDLSEFAVEDARLDLSGASDITVNSSGKLDVEASGASDVYYLGEPTIGNLETSGASSIARR